MGQANLARQGQPIFKISGKNTEVGELVRGRVGGGWVANDKGGARKGRRKDFDVLPCKGKTEVFWGWGEGEGVGTACSDWEVVNRGWRV